MNPVMWKLLLPIRLVLIFALLLFLGIISLFDRESASETWTDVWQDIGW